MDPTVTISRTHFDTLVRRAEFHTNNTVFPDGRDEIVVITAAEYNTLKTAAREYALLRQTLILGGLAEETLNVLLQNGTQGSDPKPAPTQDTSTIYSEALGTSYQALSPAVPVAAYSRPVPNRIRSRANATFTPSITTTRNTKFTTATTPSLTVPDGPKHHSSNQSPPSNSSPSYTPPDSSPNDDESDGVGIIRNQPPFPRFDQRTLFLTNLPDKTTHKELVGVVRGGVVLDIHLRYDRTACLSFVDGAAASDFLRYAKRQGVYVRGKRMEARWADRQFHMPAHVAYKVASGATRNLVIRNGAGKINEVEIRHHMEHIHNLAIIDVTFKNGDVHIETNSVHNSLFARTCMLSRLPYKGMRIEWFPDECAAPIPMVEKPAPVASIEKKRTTVTPNMYSLLEMDPSEEGEDTVDSSLEGADESTIGEYGIGESEVESSVQDTSTDFGRGMGPINWADVSAATMLL